MNARIARIDLRDFKTKQILGPVPNVSGQPRLGVRHAEHRVRDDGVALLDPDPEGERRSRSTSTPPTTRASSGAIKIDPKTGEMSLGWQILTPPFNWDLGDAGKKVSDGWMFWTCYNSERATGKLEVTASQADRDYIAAVDWKAAEKAVAEGKGDMIGGVKVLDPKKVPGIIYLMPCGKSPHGVDVSPDGKYIIGSGKLQGVTTAFNFEKVQTAIRNKDFTGDEDGIPVLKYESIKDAEVAGRPRPAPHAVRRRTARPTPRSSSTRAVAKWKLGTWEVVDKIPMSYSIGHLLRRRGRHRQPRREVPRRPQQALPRPAPLASARRSPSRRSSSTSPRRR